MRAPRVLEDPCPPLPWGADSSGRLHEGPGARVHTHNSVTDCPAGGQRGVHTGEGRGVRRRRLWTEIRTPQQHAQPIAWEGGRQGARRAIPREAWGRQGLGSCVHHSGLQELG